jgi:hypothetical protein
MEGNATAIEGAANRFSRTFNIAESLCQGLSACIHFEITILNMVDQENCSEGFYALPIVILSTIHRLK